MTSFDVLVGILPTLVGFLIFFVRVVGIYLPRWWACSNFYFGRYVSGYQVVTYTEAPLSPLTHALLLAAERKILVLDLDETLIHSHLVENDVHMSRHTIRKGTPYDFELDVVVDQVPMHFYVFKRPHLDLFLRFAAKWYELVIYTASLECYASAVLNRIDEDHSLFSGYLYRQHCRSVEGILTKDLNHVTCEMRNILIIDNSPSAVRFAQNNAITIKSWYCDQTDSELLKLLPFLDALRFTKDVRTILSRYKHGTPRSFDYQMNQ